MATKETLTQIRRSIEDCVGKKVVLRTNKGRKKVKTREGVLEEAYPNVFVVRIDDGLCSQRKVSYSYSDVLTDSVEITLSGTQTLIHSNVT
jgi:uncharacterized protein Veg